MKLTLRLVIREFSTLREKDGRHAACIIEPKKVNQEA